MGRNRKHTKDKAPSRLKPTGGGYIARTLTVRMQVRIRRRSHKAARKARAALPTLLSRLARALTRADPVEVVMTLAGWSMYAGVGNDGTLGRPVLADIDQADIELLLAMMASTDARAWGRDAVSPHALQDIIETAGKLQQTFSAMRMSEVGTRKDAASHAALLLQERVRLHTQVMRNWGYPDRVIALTRDLYAPLDEALMAALGFGASDVITLFENLAALRLGQYNTQREQLGHVFRQATVRGAVATYLAQTALAGDVDEFLGNAPPDVGLADVRAILLGHSNHTMAAYAFMTRADVADCAGLPVGVVERILAEITVVPGDLDSRNVMDAFLGNPVWERPVLGYGDRFVVPTPHIFFSHVHRAMNRLFATAQLSERLHARRARFLEDCTEAAFQSAFPAAAIQRGKQWNWDGERYESDLIVLIDQTLLIVEAKAGALTPSALRGAPERLKKHVQELVEKPAIQGSRLERVVRMAKDGNENARRVTDKLGIPAEQIASILRLSVTLDDFSAIASMERDLKDARWLREDTDLAPVLSIADLECVADILEKPALILHYLKTRGRLQKAVLLLGDELDCLGSYLADGLVVPRAQGRPLLQISGQSAVVDRYFMLRGVGIAAEKPKRHLTPWFDALLDALHERAPGGWTTMAFAVLNGLDSVLAGDLDEGLERLRLSVPAERHIPTHICSRVFVPNDPADPVVIYYVYCRADRDERDERVSRIAAETMDNTGKDSCIIIGRMVEAWDVPYAFCGLSRRPAD